MFREIRESWPNSNRRPLILKAIFFGGTCTMPPKDSTYETESKIDMAKLREAVQKVFAYGSSSSRKDSVKAPPVKHRGSAQKKVARTTGWFCSPFRDHQPRPWSPGQGFFVFDPALTVAEFYGFNSKEFGSIFPAKSPICTIGHNKSVDQLWNSKRNWRDMAVVECFALSSS